MLSFQDSLCWIPAALSFTCRLAAWAPEGLSGWRPAPPQLPFIIFTAKINEHINLMFGDDGKWTPWAQIYQQRAIARLNGGGKVRRTVPVGGGSWAGLGFRWGWSDKSAG